MSDSNGRSESSIAVASASPAHAELDSSFLDDKNKAFSKYDPFEQFIVLGNDLRDYMTPVYIADALDDKLSALGRTGYIRRCMASKTPSLWAICQGDIELFDDVKPGKHLSRIEANGRLVYEGTCYKYVEEALHHGHEGGHVR